MDFSIQRLLKEGIKAVPAVRYALGVAAIAAAVAIVSGFIKDYRVAVLGTVIMFGLMSALVVFSSLAKTAAKDIRLLALFLAWCSVVLITVTSILILTGFFFQWPRPLTTYVEVITRSPTNEPNAVLPSPSPSAAPTRLSKHSEPAPQISEGVQTQKSSAGIISFAEKKYWPWLVGKWVMRWDDLADQPDGMPIEFFEDGQVLKCKMNVRTDLTPPCTKLIVDDTARIIFSFGGADYIGNINLNQPTIRGLLVDPQLRVGSKWIMTK